MMFNKTSLLITVITLASLSGTACWNASKSNDSNSVAVNYAPYETNSKTGNSPSRNSNVSNVNVAADKKPTGFAANLPSGFKQPTDDVGKKLLKEYGSVFVAKNGAIAPTTVVFKDEAEVSAFQNALQKASESLGGFTLELQAPAMKDLKEAIADAKTQGLSISPRGADSAKRTYTETVGLWKSRVDPALTHWTGKGKITQADADRIKKMSPFEQVSEVLKLEENGIFFAKDLSKSIIYSVAPPGTSQHLSLLALDVKEFDDAKVRAILAQHGWFQTVASDLPHFTYLGVKESELEGLGLKKNTDGGRTFWVPAI